MSYLSDLLGPAYREGMTEEDISAALEARRQDDEGELSKLKGLLNKANTEAAKYKKDLQAAQGEKEKTDGEKNDLQATVAQLQKRLDISDRAARLSALGMDAEKAKSIAEASVDGNFDDILNGIKEFAEAAGKKAVADAVKGTPAPGSGGSDTGDKDWLKLADEAQARGDFTAFAYYTRLANTEPPEE